MSCCGNSNPINVNSGGGLTMKKKVGARFARISSGGFSLNGINNNNRFNNIGNPNSAIAYVGCKSLDNNIKTSVKNYSGYMQTRIVNNQLKCSPVNSFDCYKKVNSALVAIDGNLNKHFNNKDQSSRIQLLKAKCNLDRSNYKDLILVNSSNCLNANTQNSTSTNRTQYLARQCNITKDVNKINGYTPGYGIYYNDSTLFGKKKCLHNPADAKNIAC